MHLGGDGRDGLQQARIRLNCFAITDALNDTASQSPGGQKSSKPRQRMMETCLSYFFSLSKKILK